jgi:hypothetical protein
MAHAWQTTSSCTRRSSRSSVQASAEDAGACGGAVAQERYAAAAGATQSVGDRRVGLPTRPAVYSCTLAVRARRVKTLHWARLVLGAPGRWQDDVPLAAGRRGSTAPFAAALLLTANRSPKQKNGATETASGFATRDRWRDTMPLDLKIQGIHCGQYSYI